MKTRGISVDAAVDMAKDRVAKNVVVINRRAIMAPGLLAEDKGAVVSVLGDFYRQNEKFLKSEGVASPEAVSLVPRGHGIFRPIDAKTGMPVMIPVERDGVKTLGVSSITLSDIRRTRADIRNREEQDAIAAAEVSVFRQRALNAPGNRSALDAVGDARSDEGGPEVHQSRQVG